MVAENTITLIISTSEDFGWLMQHRAILFKHEDEDYILHQTFSGPEVITFEKFLRKRAVLYKKTYKLKQNIEIEKEIANPLFHNFNLFTANCESFVNDIIRKYTNNYAPPVSQQITFWTLITLYILTHINSHK